MKKKKIDLLILLLLLGGGFGFTLVFNLKPLTGSILFLLIPSLYLAWRERKNFLKIFWAVFIFGGLFGFIFDFIQTFNKAWVVERLVMPWKILGIMPVDDLLGFLLMTLFIVVFYEHFLDDEKNRKISKNLIWSLVPALFAIGVIVILFLINPNFLRISYAYLVGGITAIIFPIFLSFYKPRLIPKFLKIGGFFFFVWFVAEIVALKTGGWIFPGEYLINVEVFGVSFPFEELFFWTLFYAAWVVSFYEFFVDDMR